MGRPVSFRKRGAQRALVALAAAGVALGAGAASARAADAAPEPPAGGTTLGEVDPQAALDAVTTTVGYAVKSAAGLKPNPLAGTGVDPLDNAVGAQLADFRPLSSKALTGPVAQAESVGGIPVVGGVAALAGG
ncbi:MAG TPA: hypothetical protein VFP69_14430 [Streptomyces sp.]|nr:hypothetical protein [Streptomyces sp.]